MATAVASATSAAIAAQPAVSQTAPRETTSSNTSDPFQTILAQASTAAQSPQATRDANQAALNAEAADQAEKDRNDGSEAANELTAAQLAGQLGLTQLATNNTPLSTPGTLPTGQLVTDAVKLTSTDLRAVQADAAAVAAATPQTGTAAQNNAPVPAPVPQTTLPANAAPAQPAAQPVPAQPSVAQATLPQPTPTPTPTPTPATGTAAVIDQVQRQVVTAQVPIVPGLLPTQPEAAANSQLPAPIVAPQAPTEAAPLPSVSIGDRPANAGERFAAAASTATTLLPNTAPVTTDTANVFAQTLAGTDTANANAADLINVVPNQLGEPNEWRVTAGRDTPETQPTGIAPAVGTAQAPQPVSHAQTTAAVRTPDPVAQVADNIVTHAHVLARGSETEFRMRLDPPELGSVRIKLVSSGDSINGQVVVSNDAIRRMIESQLPELRQRLEQAGVTVQNFSVTADANSGAGANGDTWGGYRSEFPADLPRQSTAPVQARLAPARTAGAIDVMA